MTNIDLIQVNAASGASYQVPEVGTITSWSHNAGPGASQMATMKVYRKTREPNFFTVVGLDGPHPLTASLVNTFRVAIPVQPGDIVGIDGTAGAVSTLFPSVAADAFFNRTGSMSLGEEASFSGPATGSRVNVSAVLAPSNTVALGATALNKKKGTATLSLTLPNSGNLAASGSGAQVTSTGAVSAGAVQLLVSATGKQRKKLNAKGKVTLNVALTFTPANGDPGTQSVAVKLSKKIKTK